MKIRNGFVSNSSSSSFVLAGIKFKSSELELTDEQREELFENFLVLSHPEDGAPKGFTIIGETLAESEYEGFDSEEFSLEDIQRLIAKAEEAVLRVTGKTDPMQVKRGIFTGTRCC